MRFVFCADPLSPRRPDPDYEAEVEAVRDLGIAGDLIGFEDLVAGNPAAAVRRVAPADPPETAVYRGWMLRATDYEALHGALAARGLHLINDPAAYRHAHHLPESYDAIREVTPRSVWLPAGHDFSIDRLADLARSTFGDQPIVVKDYVKSRKHEWAEACYVPAASDRAALTKVVGRFLDLQGEDLTGGIVLREFVDLDRIGTHPKSGLPLGREYRAFVLDGDPIAWFPYWEDAEYGDSAPPVETFSAVARSVRSRFFTLDVARRADGAWIAIELGDGQVAGLPGTADPISFYQAIARRLGAEEA